MGGRFPALAVFGLPALTVMVALFVLWGLRPWEDNSADPHEVPLGIEAAVGGGRALSAGSTAQVAAGVAVMIGSYEVPMVASWIAATIAAFVGMMTIIELRR